VTDGEPVVFREFVERLLATQGLTAPDRTIPRGFGGASAAGGETLWKLLPMPGRPPVTRLAFWLAVLETTIDITRARTELGYTPLRTIEDGLEELSQS
jgi:nucleoside-diphosphate-sugar epimerase